MNYVRELRLEDLIREALKEDIGRRDITTEFLIPIDKTVKAVILAKENCVICGIDVAKLVFNTLDKKIKFKSGLRDGTAVKKGKIIASLSGKARSILSAERTALNFLGFLSGIATKTKKFTEAVKPYPVKILDTRKTIPGWRLLQKYAVRTGGAFNHRLCLEEMVMVKDNHLKVMKGMRPINGIEKKYKLEIEVKNLGELKEAMKFNPDIIMFDNMDIKQMRRAVLFARKMQAKGKKTLLEASGGISLNNIRKFASTGVDLISVGTLTHSVDSADISLEII